MSYASFGAPASSADVQQAASSSKTANALAQFYATVLDQYKKGKFDISKLGEAYEGMAAYLPIAAQYVQARRAVFDFFDSIGIGRAVRLLYHSSEAGARVSAAITAQAALVAASNYGSAGATALSAASLMAGVAGPVGLGVAIVVGALSGLFGGDDPEADLAQLAAAREQARAALKGVAAWPAAARKVFEGTPFFATLTTIANTDFNDPLGFIADPTIREQLRIGIYNATNPHVILDDKAMYQAFYDRLAKVQATTAQASAASPVAKPLFKLRPPTFIAKEPSKVVPLLIGLAGGGLAVGLVVKMALAKKHARTGLRRAA